MNIATPPRPSPVLMALKTDAKTDSEKSPQSLVITGFAGTQIGKKLIQIADKMAKKEARSPKMTETSLIPSKAPRNNKKDLHFCKSSGADTRIRTGDLILTKGDHLGFECVEMIG